MRIAAVPFALNAETLDGRVADGMRAGLMGLLTALAPAAGRRTFPLEAW